MADSVAGLFGLNMGGDRESILQQIVKERQGANVAKTQGLGPFAGLAQAGMESAQGLQDQTAKLFGVEDPRLQKQTKIQDAAEAVRQRGIDTKDAAATYQAFYEELAKRGMYGEATALIPKIQEAQQKAAETGLREREVAAREKQVAQAEAPKAEATTINGVAVYRAPNGAPFVFENGRQVPYNPQVHGRLQTQMDKPATGIAGMLGGLPTPAAGTPTATGKTKKVKEYDPKTGKIVEVEVPA